MASDRRSARPEPVRRWGGAHHDSAASFSVTTCRIHHVVSFLGSLRPSLSFLITSRVSALSSSRSALMSWVYPHELKLGCVSKKDSTTGSVHASLSGASAMLACTASTNLCAAGHLTVSSEHERGMVCTGGIGDGKLPADPS